MAAWRLNYPSTELLEPLRLEIVPRPKAADLCKERLMNAPTSAAAARKPLPVKSDLEAEISNLLDPEGQKLPAQIEDDGDESGPLSRG